MHAETQHIQVRQRRFESNGLTVVQINSLAMPNITKESN